MHRVQGSPQRHNQFCRRFKDPDDFIRKFLPDSQNLPRGRQIKLRESFNPKSVKKERRAAITNWVRIGHQGSWFDWTLSFLIKPFSTVNSIKNDRSNTPTLPASMSGTKRRIICGWWLNCARVAHWIMCSNRTRNCHWMKFARLAPICCVGCMRYIRARYALAI